MARVVNSEDEPGFRIGIGVNSGRVVAGSIGGAGRLNFSIIGDAVNVADRVESATRELDEEVLITEATARELSDAVELTDCGMHELKGLPEPLRLYAPRIRDAAGVQPGEEPLAAERGDGRRGDLHPTRGELGEARRTGGLAPL
jgi:class 3 adenylate cyclase